MRVAPLLAALLLCAPPAGAQLVNVTPSKLQTATQTYGVGWSDFDRDGDVDLLTTGGTANRVLRNVGLGTFLDVAFPPLLDAFPSAGVSWADYDADGDHDVLLHGVRLVGRADGGGSGGASGKVRLFRNESGFVFSEVTSITLGDSLMSVHPTWVDVDLDGDLDVFAPTIGGAQLMRNDGGGVFVDTTPGPIAADLELALHAAWTDLEGDGDPDVYVCNYGGQNRLWRNDGGNVFVDVAASLDIDDGGLGYAAAWGDYDLDGDADLYLVNAEQPNRLFRNDGGTFADVTLAPLNDAGVGGRPQWVDAENDGDLDLYLPNDAGDARLLRNDAGVFVDATAELPPTTDDVATGAWADYDDDGDLDLFEGTRFAADRLLRNDVRLARGGTDPAGWITLDLTGTASNRSAIGARVTTRYRTTLGRLGAPFDALALREVTGGSSPGPLRVHVGLGEAERTGLVTIRWPSGTVQTLSGLPTGLRLDVEEAPSVWNAIETPAAAVAASFGATFADVDDDGDQDLFVANTAGPSVLYLNDGTGALTAADAGDAAVDANACAFADYDADGDLDAFLCREAGSRLLRNDAGVFADVSTFGMGTSEEVMGAAWGDLDGDGRLDLVVVNDDFAPPQLFQNTGTSFAGVMGSGLDESGGAKCVSLIDYDTDGDLDVAISGRSAAAADLYRNEGELFFVPIEDAYPDARPGTLGRGFSDRPSHAFGDYDNDGDLDVFVAGEGPLSDLYRNDGGVFAKIEPPALEDLDEAYSASWLDHDLDGDLDLLVVDDDRQDRLVRNDGGSFVLDVSGPLADFGRGRGSAVADLEGDGDLDVFVSRPGEANALYRNERTGRWLAVDLRGTASNSRGVGARLRIVSASRVQRRDVEARSGPGSHNALTAHVGLGADAVVDSLVVFWPSGARQVLTALAADQRLVVTEPPPPFVNVATGALEGPGDHHAAAWGDYDTDGDPDLFLPALAGAPNALLRNDGDLVFTDVTAGPLVGTDEGRTAVWGDIDEDGDPDLFVGAGAAGVNQLLRNDDGVFVDIASAELQDAGAETRAASFADVDLDGDLDLYVAVSGAPGRLFLNDGAGGYTELAGTSFEGDGNAATWSDLDADGDSDLVVTRSTGLAMGLYRNDGQGVFADVTDAWTIVPVVRVGARAREEAPRGITGHGLATGDYDADGDLDLFVARDPGSTLWRNDLPQGFVEPGAPWDPGVSRVISASFADSDRDGDLDLFLATRDGDHLVRNDGAAGFVRATPQAMRDASLESRAAPWADADGDGDLDLHLVTSAGHPDRLYRNDLADETHWVAVRPEGVSSNRAGIGARVRAVTGGVAQLREITTGDGHAQGERAAFFGLGAADLLDTLEVRWPSGEVQTFTGVGVDRRIELREDAVTPALEGVDAVAPAPLGVRLEQNRPNPFNPQTRIVFGVPAGTRVTLAIFDPAGRRVRTLVDGARASGREVVRWDGTDAAGRAVASGTYFYVLEAGERRVTRRMQLVR